MCRTARCGIVVKCQVELAVGLRWGRGWQPLWAQRRDAQATPAPVSGNTSPWLVLPLTGAGLTSAEQAGLLAGRVAPLWSPGR